MKHVNSFADYTTDELKGILLAGRKNQAASAGFFSFTGWQEIVYAL
jgi:hypothetical protein